MKKLLLLIIVIMAVALVAQRLKLVIFFPNTSKLPNYVSPVPQDQTAKILIPTMTKENNRTYLGIRYKMIDKQTAKLNKISEGAYITQVIDNSPAYKFGLSEEDIIIEVNGKKIGGSDEQTLVELIRQKKLGERVSLKIWRNKEVKTILVTLETAK